jgi:hypothetical protein
MTTRNGTAARIVAYVAAHTGCTRAELLQGCGIADYRDAMPTYCAKAGLIFPAGPRGSQRYFPHAEMAQARHQAIVDAVAEQRERKKRVGWLRDNARKAKLRQEKRAEVLGNIRARAEARRRARALLPKDVRIPVGVKVVVAPPMRDRWAA